MSHGSSLPAAAVPITSRTPELFKYTIAVKILQKNRQENQTSLYSLIILSSGRKLAQFDFQSCQKINKKLLKFTVSGSELLKTNFGFVFSF
jgi:hypothetical protein